MPSERSAARKSASLVWFRNEGEFFLSLEGDAQVRYAFSCGKDNGKRCIASSDFPNQDVSPSVRKSDVDDTGIHTAGTRTAGCEDDPLSSVQEQQRINPRTTVQPTTPPSRACGKTLVLGGAAALALR